MSKNREDVFFFFKKNLFLGPNQQAPHETETQHLKVIQTKYLAALTWE